MHTVRGMPPSRGSVLWMAETSLAMTRLSHLGDSRSLLARNPMLKAIRSTFYCIKAEITLGLSPWIIPILINRWYG